MMKQLTIIVLFFINHAFAQNSTLNDLRAKHCIKHFEMYKKELADLSKPPKPPNWKKEKFVKAFNIPANERRKLFPFSNYDSIFIAVPNAAEITADSVMQQKDSVNYLPAKNHIKIKLLTWKEKDDLSDILFNYYVFNDDNIQVFNEVGCFCPELYYPKLIFLFHKQGIDRDVLTLFGQDQSDYQTSFKDFWIDGYNQKKEMIFKLFNTLGK